MKNLILLTLVSLSSATAFAQVPRELQDLIPTGSNQIRMTGRTADSQKCIVDLSATASTYGASVMVLDKTGAVDSRRLGKFQIGFGHELQSIQAQGGRIVAVSIHGKEESYSADSRATLTVTKTQDSIQSVQIVVEEKGLFGFKTAVKETCQF